MKSRISFFNPTALRKDITRFAPVWGLYLIAGFLVGLDLVGYSYVNGYRAVNLSESIGAFGVVNLFYALVCAELLFGDLFNSKLCNALHALPMRRESWFLTHTVTGIAFSLVPNLILSLFFLPFMDGMWYISIIWLLGVTLQYLFFFGLAALSAVCTGNRIGMAVIYGVANFLSMIAAWFVGTFYEPLLYGLHLRYEGFQLLCPSYWITNMDDLVVFQRYSRQEYSDMFGEYSERTQYVYDGLGEGWGYLAILAVLGLVFLGLGIALYRRRKLESAGDFIAFRPMMPVFSVILTLSTGAVFQIICELTMGDSYLFLAVGILVGYFGCQMLLQRTVKVFRKKAFLKCAAIGGALLLSIGLTWLDPLGVTQWTPEPSQVQSIILTEDYYYEPEYDEEAMIIDNPGLIRELVEIHGEILQEDIPVDTVFHYDDYYVATAPIHLTYQMSDGRQIERRYHYREDGIAAEKLEKFLSSPEYVLGYEDWEEFLSSITCAYVDWGEEITGAELRELAEAVKADCEAGTMVQGRRDVAYYIHFEQGTDQSVSVIVFADCANTLEWIKANDFGWDVIGKYD